MKNISLRIVLILSFVSVTVFSIGIIGYLSYYNGRSAVGEMAHQLRSDITLRIQEHLGKFLKTPHQINELNSRAMREGTLDAADQDQLQRRFWNQVRIFNSVTSIYFGNTLGGNVNSGREGAGGAQYIITTDGFESGPFRKYATDEYGNLADLLVTVPDFDSRKRPWYTGAVDKNGPYWTAPYILFTGQDMAIAASLPVYNDREELLGVVSVDIFLSHLSNFLNNVDIGATGEAFIMERSGMLLATSTDEKPFTESAQGEGRRRIGAGESSNEHIRDAALAIKNKFGDYSNIESEQQFEYESEGETHYLQISPVKDENGLDWLVVVVDSESDFLNHLNASNRTTALLMLLTLVASIGVAVVIGRQINKPIEQLTFSARAMEDGTWTTPIRDNSRLAEVSQLIKSFNKMAGNLEREKTFTRSVLDSIPDTVYVFDTVTGYPVIWNRAMSEISGYSDEEILSKKAVADWYSEEDQERAFRAISNISEASNSVIEIELITKDGRGIPTEYHASRLPETIEKGSLLVSVGRDLTERKKAEELLRESEKRFRISVMNSPLPIMVHAEDGEILFINEVWTELSGYGKDEIPTIEAWTEKVYGERKKFADAAIKKMFDNGGKTYEGEFRLEMKGGGSRIWDFYSSPLGSLSDGRRLVLSIATDVTERKQAERDKDALQQQLLQAQKMEAIGILAGGVAHDFNNILAIIMGSAQLAQYEVAEGSGVAEELKIIIDSADRARDLTMKLLTFARKERTNKAVNNVKTLLDGVTGILERSLSKGIKISAVVNQDVSIFCDVNQMHQAIMNICTNAADAMSMGGSLNIEAGETEFEDGLCDICGDAMPGKYCRIGISDTGTGIPGEILQKVIEPFFTTKGVGKGTGLGLSVTDGIISSHGGHMHICSQLKKGTCIKIYLPVCDKGQAEEIPEMTKKVTGGAETILIIDDEKPLLDIMGRFLRKKGYVPLLASSGRDGIDIFLENRERISVVVLDLMMPEMDGADTFRELKEIDPEVKVVFASGYSMNKETTALMSEGSHRFVQKPFDVEKMCATIRSAIDDSDGSC